MLHDRAADASSHALVEIMATLRGPERLPVGSRADARHRCGRSCSRKPTRCSRRSTRGDTAALREELGDFLFEAVFLAQLEPRRRALHRSPTRCTSDRRQAGAAPSARLRARRAASRALDVGRAGERASGRRSRRRSATARRRRPKTLLERRPPALPALLRAYQIGTRAASVGFDWAQAGRRRRQDPGGGRRAARRSSGATTPSTGARAEEEMGDLLFADRATCRASWASSRRRRCARRTTSSRRGSTAMERLAKDEGRPLQARNLKEPGSAVAARQARGDQRRIALRHGGHTQRQAGCLGHRPRRDRRPPREHGLSRLTAWGANRPRAAIARRRHFPVAVGAPHAGACRGQPLQDPGASGGRSGCRGRH